jgi:hypothetical protein
MKDTVITAKRKKTELITLLVLFILSNLINVYAIVAYNSPAIELFMSLGFVVASTLVLYVVWTLLRLLTYALRQIRRKNNTEASNMKIF